MNHSDCAIEKSAMQTSVPSMKTRPSPSCCSSQPRYWLSCARASCGPGRRTPAVIAARSAAKAFRNSGVACGRMPVGPPSWMVSGTATQNSAESAHCASTGAMPLQLARVQRRLRRQASMTRHISAVSQ